MSKPAVAGKGAVSAGDSYVAGHGNGGYQVQRYELELNYKVASNRLAGRAVLAAVATEPLSRLSLDLSRLTVSKVLVNGSPAKFSQTGHKLQIWPAAALAAGAAFTMAIAYAGSPRPINGRWGQLGWDELTDGVIVASQPNGAPSWFPCNDHPSNKASFRISVTVESSYEVISNGSLIDKRRAGSSTTWVYDQPEPMATYLATVQIGRYEFVELAGSPVPTRAAVPPRRRALFHGDFDRQQEMMVLFSRLFGPYPFAGYTVVITDDPLEIPLEAQGMSIFGSNFLNGRRGHERLVAHELAHQWFGNSVTLDSWRHIWLHEGFACYAEWLWAENSGGLTANGSAGVARSSLLLLPQDLIIGDPGPTRMFDNQVYLRGALTVHALRQQMGDWAFFALVQEWVAEHRHGNVNTDAFVELAAQRGGDRQLLRRWLFQAALPAAR